MKNSHNMQEVKNYLSAKKFKWKASECSFSEQEMSGMRHLALENLGDIDIAKADYLNWQYFKNPAGRPVIWLAKDAEKIIGQAVFIPIMIIAGGNSVLGACAANIITDSNYANKGVFAILAQKAFDQIRASDIKVVYGFPNKYAYPTWIKRTPFKDIGSITDMVKILRYENILGKRISSVFLKNIIKIIGKISFFSMFKKSKSFFSIDEVSRFDDSFDGFWEQNSSGSLNAVIRKKEYLNWRFVDCPGREYKIFCAKRENKIIGYIILRIMDESGLKTGWILDVFSGVSNTGLRASKILVDRTLKYFDEKRVDIARSAAIKGSIGYKALRSNGFLPVPKIAKMWPKKIILASFLSGAKDIGRLDDWHITLADNDAL